MNDGEYLILSIGGGGVAAVHNGLMVAACVLKQEGLAERVGILDFDEHYGDGTDDIIERLGAGWVVHYTAGRHWQSPAQAESFLAEIPAIVDTMAGCDVVLYQAGADPHVDDPLGGWLTTDQLRRRDRAVFEACRTLGLPVAWNLAGGYQEDRRRIVEIHVNTTGECVEVYGGPVRGEGARATWPKVLQTSHPRLPSMRTDGPRGGFLWSHIAGRSTIV